MTNIKKFRIKSFKEKKSILKLENKWMNKKFIVQEVMLEKGYFPVIEDNEILAVGGRVLNFISLSENLSSARENIHNNLNKLNWVEGFYRKDIAFKVIEK